MIKNRIKEISSGLSESMKASIVYIFAGLFTKGLSIITVPIFTRIMTTAEIGTVSVYTSWASMLGVVLTLALTSGGYMVAMKEFSDKRDAYSSSVLTITTLMTVAFAIIYLCFREKINNILGLPTSIVALMIVGFLVEPAREFWLSRNRYEIKYKTVAIYSIFVGISGATLAIVCVLLAKRNGVEHLDYVRLYANYAVVYGCALILYIRTFLKGRTFYKKKYWTFSLKLSVPLIGNSLATQVFSVSDRTMISSMVGKAEVGIYSTLYNCSSICNIVWNAINSSFIPFLFQNFDTKEGREKVRRTTNFIILFYACIAMFMTLLAPEIIRILATEEYYEAIYIMPPIAGGIFFTSLNNVYSDTLLYRKKTNSIMISSIIAAALNVGLNAALIPIFGYQVAAYTTLIAYIIWTLVQAMVSNYTERINGERGLYDNKFMIFISTVVVCFNIACIFIYNYSIIRYALIAIFVIVAVVMRKRIVNIVLSMK